MIEELDERYAVAMARRAMLKVELEILIGCVKCGARVLELNEHAEPKPVKGALLIAIGPESPMKPYCEKCAKLFGAF